MNERTSPPPQRSAPWVLLGIMLLSALDRLGVLLQFGFTHVGNDDAIFWQAVRDYAQGVFHEPFMYGQDYTVMLEAFAAVPFHLLGMPLNIALPLVTSLLILLPFWSMAWWAHRQGKVTWSLAIAAFPLLLPVTFGIITSMPRGFVGGCAMLAAWPWCTTIARPLWRGAAAGLVLGASLFLNPNTLLFVAPVALLFAWEERSNFNVHLAALLGASVGGAAWFFAKAFYAEHPEYVHHTIGDWMLIFHAEGITEAMGQLNAHFAWLAPVLWPFGAITFFALLPLMALLFVQRQWSAGLSLLVCTLVIIASFGYAKVHDGVTHPFFPYSRMFLALPFVLLWWLGQVQFRWKPSPKMQVMFVLGLMVVCVVKWKRTPDVVTHILATQHRSPVQSRPLRDITSDCNYLALVARKEMVDMILVQRGADHIQSYLNCYLCELIGPGLPPTIGLGFDRRTWRRELLAHAPGQRMLLLGKEALSDSLLPPYDEQGPEGMTLYILRAGDQATGHILENALK